MKYLSAMELRPLASSLQKTKIPHPHTHKNTILLWHALWQN